MSKAESTFTHFCHDCGRQIYNYGEHSADHTIETKEYNFEKGCVGCGFVSVYNIVKYSEIRGKEGQIQLCKECLKIFKRIEAAFEKEAN